jgi:hypothetical protein
VYGFLDSSHVFVLVHIVLDIGLSSSCLPGERAFGGEVAGAIAIVALSDPLLGAALKGSLYLGNVPSEVLLVCSVRGEASSREVHWDGDIVHGSWGIRGVELWWSLAVVELLWGSVIESL